MKKMLFLGARLKRNTNCEYLVNRLREANIETNKLHSYYKRRYYGKLFHNSYSDSKKTWRTINTILGRSTRSTSIESLNFGDGVTPLPRIKQLFRRK